MTLKHMNTKLFTGFSVLCCCVAVFCGCTRNPLDRKYAETDPVLVLETDKIEVDCASFSVNEPLKAGFSVKSNRSWSLSNLQGSSWFEVFTTSDLNLGNTPREKYVELSLEDNLSDTPRESDLSVSTDDGHSLLTVCQKAYSPVLLLESEASIPDVSEKGGEYWIKLKANCEWTASVDPSSTAKIVLAATQGVKSDSLKFTVKANSDIYSAKQGSVIVSAHGAEPLQVNVNQAICVPYLEADAEHSEPDVLPAAGWSRFAFKTNVSWTAEILSSSDPAIALSAEAGEATESSLSVYFPQATLSGASATVKITAITGESIQMDFVQRPAVFFNFRKWPDNIGWSSVYSGGIVGWTSGSYDIGRYDPTSTDSNRQMTFGNHEEKLVDYNLKVVFWDGESYFHSNACGLVIGSITENPAFRITLPAIEGKKLVEVKYMLGTSEYTLKNREAAATGKTSFITDADGKVVCAEQTIETFKEGPEWAASGNTIPDFASEYANHKASMFDFVIPNPQENAKYCIVGTYRQVIRWFILYYE